MQILIGTNNKNKLKQFKLAFAKHLPDYEIKSLGDLGIDTEVEEDEDSLLGNAVKKAKFYGELSGMLTLSDDTGLFVDALGGEPGVHAKRWHDGSERDRCARLIERLASVDEKKRTAHYLGVLAVYQPSSQKVWTFEDEVEGLITDYFKGGNGFGYDEIFELPALGKNYAELTDDEKLEINHRGKGVDEFSKNVEKLSF